MLKDNFSNFNDVLDFLAGAVDVIEEKMYLIIKEIWLSTSIPSERALAYINTFEIIYNSSFEIHPEAMKMYAASLMCLYSKKLECDSKESYDYIMSRLDKIVPIMCSYLNHEELANDAHRKPYGIYSNLLKGEWYTKRSRLLKQSGNINE